MTNKPNLDRVEQMTGKIPMIRNVTLMIAACSVHLLFIHTAHSDDAHPPTIDQTLDELGVQVTLGDFHSFRQKEWKLDKAVCRIVAPKQPAKGNPWIWRARFWGHQPAFDIAMLNRGWHIAYCDVAGLFGSDQALDRWDRFYAQTQSMGLHQKPVVEAMSRGGLVAMRWSSRDPRRVAGICLDNAVLDFRSWPAAKFNGKKGLGKGAPNAWKQCLSAYGLTDEAAMSFSDGPLNRLKPLAEKNVPILALINEADNVVPPSENANRLVQEYQALGGKILEIRRPDLGHHPHGLKDPIPIVRFALSLVKSVPR